MASKLKRIRGCTSGRHSAKAGIQFFEIELVPLLHGDNVWISGSSLPTGQAGPRMTIDDFMHRL